jgi:hypothetical protein
LHEKRIIKISVVWVQQHIKDWGRACFFLIFSSSFLKLTVFCFIRNSRIGITPNRITAGV